MSRAEPRVVQIRVAGSVGPVVAEHLPDFLAIRDAPVTVITGRLDPGEDLATIMSLLIRHGVHPLGGRVTPAPAVSADCGADRASTL